LYAQFDDSRDITGGLKILRGSRDPDHAPFKGDLAFSLLGNEFTYFTQ